MFECIGDYKQLGDYEPMKLGDYKQNKSKKHKLMQWITVTGSFKVTATLSEAIHNEIFHIAYHLTHQTKKQSYKPPTDLPVVFLATN